MRGVNTSVALFSMLMITALVANLGCKRRIEVTDQRAFEELVGRCIEITQPVFLVRVTREDLRFEDIERYLLVRPGTIYTPYSVADYIRGNFSPDPGGEVIEIVSEGTKLKLTRAWQISGFEGAILIVTGEVSTQKEGRLLVDIGQLLDDVWRLDLADGQLSDFEQHELANREMLDHRYSRFCNSP